MYSSRYVIALHRPTQIKHRDFLCTTTKQMPKFQSAHLPDKMFNMIKRTFVWISVHRISTGYSFIHLLLHHKGSTRYMYVHTQKYTVKK